ncbi:transport permease protein [Planomonospora parontospora subsp. parontospora]|uniref:Transport permease protein n=2 Tax=Planomonospora parontospora TaxID=58119 RepID=A0AA37BK17_9ACTN|nr:ABC transporter permease [Planomonospora parontospora]GGK83166.1 transport permease protein [Planomonospora parontospora]GII10425.1 transport permease protein [Planomonospora parontospora subsp. parontospora]
MNGVVRQSWLVLRHTTRVALRQKTGLVFGALQPLLYLVLFGPLFATVGTWEVLVPGLLAQLGLFSAGLAGFGIVFDARSGVLERLRVTPAHRVALLLGRVLGSSLTLLLQSAALVAVGYALGLRAPLPGVLAGLVLMALLGVGLAALSNAIALTMNPDLFAPVMSTVVVPLTLLSGAFLPMSMAPAWLDALSRATPFRYVVEAVRDLFAGRYLTPAVAAGVAVTAVLTVACTVIGTRVFDRANA